jgi:hypothetical protein
VQEGCGGVLAVRDHVVGEARSQGVDGPLEQPLGGRVLAVPRTIVLDIERQGEARTDDGDQAEVVRVPADLVATVVAWPTQRAALFLAAAGSRSVDGQANEAGVVEGLVALGLPQYADRARRVGSGSSRSLK